MFCRQFDTCPSSFRHLSCNPKTVTLSPAAVRLNVCVRIICSPLHCITQNRVSTVRQDSTGGGQVEGRATITTKPPTKTALINYLTRIVSNYEIHLRRYVLPNGLVDNPPRMAKWCIYGGAQALSYHAGIIKTGLLNCLVIIV